MALDSGLRHARASLGGSYPAFDKTPFWDSLDEIKVDNHFDTKFLDANDAHGVMWDLEVDDVAGKIDLNSAGPQVIANIIGANARFNDVIAKDAKKMPVSSSSGFLSSGFAWSGGETIRYGKLEEGELRDLTRGVMGPSTDKQWFGGPAPPLDHDNGAPVLDQRALAPVLWRLNSSDGEVRKFGSLEELRLADGFVLALALNGDGSPPEAKPTAIGAKPTASSDSSSNGGPVAPTADGREPWGEETLRALRSHGTVFGGTRAGHVWQHAARLASAVEGRKDGLIRVDNLRWFNAGSTIQIRDGKSTELAMVSLVRKDGTIVLDRILVNDYPAYSAEVRVLARRPVNINTASPDVLRILFTNLQIMGRNSRITKDRAQQLAELVMQSRPFTGHEDFLRRVVLPAAGLEKLPSDAEVHPDMLSSGAGFIDAYEALALYTNGLNANDSSLLYSTMPYCYTTRDTYALELRSSVNAPSGVERFAIVRDEVDVITPQSQLLAVWARQDDFDEAMRLDCEAPWWSTGPKATSRWDHGAAPPSRLWAHMGTHADKAYLPGITDTSGMQDKESQPTAEHVFASREKDGWIQMWPARSDEEGQRKDRVLHFDHETRDPEGRYLPDEPVQRDTTDKQVVWSGKNGLMLPFSFSLWVKPRSLADATILDVMSGLDQFADRVSLLFDQGDLVLRVIDAPGDHPKTSEKEYGEVRFQLATGKGPGMPAEVWSHVDVDVRGNQPHQMNMLVNGLDHGVRTMGLTRLTGTLSQGSPSLAVESVEGFPPHCTVRVGNELIEVEVKGGMLSAARQETGQYAGFGGRIARERYSPIGDVNSTWVPDNLALISTDHPSGAPVELYGYSVPLYSDLPRGHVQLPAVLGPFRVGQLKSVVGGQTAQGDPIVVQGSLGLVPVGMGINGTDSHVTGLLLVSADQPNGANQDFMTAFNPNGGYAAIVQYLPNVQGQNGPLKDVGQAIVSGVEVIRYTGYNGTTLNIAARGNAIPELIDLKEIPQGIANIVGGKRSFVSTWDPGIYWGTIPAQNYLSLRTYVVPISLAIPGAAQADYLAANPKDPHFAQLTHVLDAENTEWVRYDYFETGQLQLVRDAPATLVQVWTTFGSGNPLGPFTLPTGGGTGGGGTGGGGTGGGGAGGGGTSGGSHSGHSFSDETSGDDSSDADSGTSEHMNAVIPSSEPADAAQSYSSQWDPRMGKPDSPWSAASTAPLSEAISSALQFRGVFGTYTHKHDTGTLILPVFMTQNLGVDAGRPGRLDTAFLVGARPDHPGWPVRVHRAIIPSSTVQVQAWKQDSVTAQNANPQPQWVAANPAMVLQDKVLTDRLLMFVALQEQSPEVMVHGTANGTPPANYVETRGLTRLMSFPSGERPRAVTRMSIGGGAAGSTAGSVPSVVVDEVVFGDSKFGQNATVDPEAGAGGSLVLSQDLTEAGTTARVNAQTVRIPWGQTGQGGAYVLSAIIRKDGGLLRIGNEILAYNQLDVNAGMITISPNGRGLLGTRPQAHQTTEPVTYLEHHTVTSLTSDVGPNDAALPIAAITEFPLEGTVLVGSELIHYTRLRDGRLEMPRASSVPGAMDEKAEPLFRGRYGTTPAAHVSGEAVILFPFRYWDRWASRAEAPELSYFTLGIDQPSAFWSSFFFDKTDTQAAQIGVLQRTSADAPWDADPDKDKRVQLYWKGDAQGQPIPIGVQSNYLEWRVFVKYAANAFDVKTGMSHGWKETPRLRQIGAFYYAPNVVLRSVER
jgi:hypothetical protein